MKRLLFLAALAAVVLTNSAANYLSMGDSVRIKPAMLDGYTHQSISMEIDAYCDQWSIAMTYPEGLSPKLVSGVVPLSGMNIGYIDCEGVFRTFDAVLSCSAGYATIEGRSCLPALWGYYDAYGNGTYLPYGSPKWEPGMHQMIEVNMYVNPSFRAGYITMDEILDCTGDTRGPILQNVHAYKKTYLWVGYLPGDLTGNEKLDISDVTELIDRVLGKTRLDEFSEKAADANRDGVVDIDDVTYITKKILG
jgi:hypothetical protein